MQMKDTRKEVGAFVSQRKVIPRDVKERFHYLHVNSCVCSHATLTKIKFSITYSKHLLFIFS